MPDQSSEKDLRLAVLIDADNASRTAMKDVMAEVAVYGTPTIKRIYGDWTSPNMSTWKSILLETAITPIQQYSYTTGKNATDSAMIIDAMDILYSGNCDGFVLVSSDSDFTRLATRLREAGIQPILMNLPPLLSQWFFDWWCRDLDQAAVRTWLGDVSNIYAHQERYSRAVESLAREERVPLVDVRGAFLAHGHLETLLCEDGTHPNSAGQALIGQAFRKFAEAQESLPETA